MKWLKKTLADGFSMLLVLKLRNAPKEDDIQTTLEAWYRTLTFKKRYEQSLDQVRFQTAFMRIAQTAEWFPTPSELLAQLPKREMPDNVQIEYQTDPEQQRAHLNKLRQILRGTYVPVKP